MEAIKKLMSWKMWLHWATIALIMLIILQVWRGGSMLTVMNVIYSAGIVAVADLGSEALLKLFKIDVD